MKTIPVIIFIMAVFYSFALAHDPAHPELDSWFMSLKNSRNVPCCDASDGHALSVDDWRSRSGQYQVMLDGEWRDVDPESVLDKEPNRAGHALVWILPHSLNAQGKHIITCFMPGAMF